jgi:sec-independent protein translocase protein TatA
LNEVQQQFRTAEYEAKKTFSLDDSDKSKKSDTDDEDSEDDEPSEPSAPKFTPPS